MSFNEKNTKHVTQLFHYNLIIFIVLRCLNCFCMVINHLKSMKYIFIIISFINTTLWKLAKLRGITPYITLIPLWLPSHQAFLPNRHFMKDPCNYTLCYYKPSPQGFWFLRLGVVFSCLFYLIFFGLSRFWITCRSTTPPVPLPKTMLRGYMPESTNRS